jgi:hypothetical protein
VREDSRGLYGEAHINLDSPAGRELYSLARQGVIQDFSVGYTAVRDKIETGTDGRKVRRIYEARLWEVSLVDEPANPNATILEVRQAPLSDEENYRGGDPLAAIVRDLQASTDLLRRERKRTSKRPTSEELLDQIMRDRRDATDDLRRERKRTAAHALDHRDDLLRRIDTALQIARRR